MSSRADALFYLLLGIIVLTPNLLSFHLFDDPKRAIFSITIVVAGLLLHLKGVKIPIPKWVGVLIGIALAVFVFRDFSMEVLPERLFIAADVLIFLQLLSEGGFRTYLYAVLLSFLNTAIVGVAFPGTLFGAIIFFYLFVLIYFLLLLAVKSSGKRLTSKVYKHLLLYSGLAYAFTLAVGSILFFLLPRPSRPLIALPGKETSKTVISFADNFQLGAFSDAALGEEPVFRAKILKKVNLSELYWRGNTLEIFQRNAWFSSPKRYAVTYPEGRIFEEKIILLPYGDRSVFTYGYPLKASTLTPYYLDLTKGVIFLRKAATKPVGLTVWATERARAKLKKPAVLLEIPPQTREVIRRFVNRYGIERKKTLEETLGELNRVFSTFEYSIDNPAADLEEFLFKYRRGNCEYFASASALILRFLGYPTRVVVGFHGGELNPITGFFVVRQKNAHAWVEIYYDQSWVRYDATVVAKRVEGVPEGVKNLEDDKLSLILDTLNTLWLEYVINLNAKKQKKLLTEFAEKVKRQIENPPWELFIFALALGGAVLLWKLRRLIAVRLYALYLRAKYGIKVSASSFAELYNTLWKKFPRILLREREKLLKLIRSFG